MSHTSSSQVSLDFWEFVTCGRCHLPFSPNSSAPPPVPFWLTECSHVVCNNHLNPDQSCPVCGSQQIQMIPLQREPEMEEPMSQWFCSLPHTIDAIANAAKFQQDMMASLVRFYKAKYHQLRTVAERYRAEALEVKTLRQTVEQQREEIEQLRRYAPSDSQEPSNIPNNHGKRRMVDAYMSGDPQSYSSPRSAMTPLGPTRLTLPASHQQPVFGAQGGGSDGLDGFPTQSERPGSSRFMQQYTYAPPRTPRQQGDVPQLQAQNATPRRQFQAMPPPPTPTARQNPKGFRPAIQQQAQASSSHTRLPRISNHPQAPAQPPRFFATTSGAQSLPQTADNRRVSTATASNRPLAQARTSTSQSRTQATSGARFVPQTPSGTNRFGPPVAAGSRATSRANKGEAGLSFGTQRAPFRPGGQTG
ncbi:hypothetical protein FA95DRAFT_1522378 [Auriscalpium vulgare]|uniref:Uncharacterized protein n=1 Tax=Auriscalpium vulgare TaxID=40419 RepID=A0ACB8RMJ1_9AGAM|nr:hypothetical protein FA95DRAFT_1522378 [Auriscalpium vulgare]